MLIVTISLRRAGDRVQSSSPAQLLCKKENVSAIFAGSRKNSSIFIRHQLQGSEIDDFAEYNVADMDSLPHQANQQEEEPPSLPSRRRTYE
jgi:hypothetical protein